MKMRLAKRACPNVRKGHVSKCGSLWRFRPKGPRSTVCAVCRCATKGVFGTLVH